MKIVHLICAARPNFMKIAPLYHILKNEAWCDIKIIHTGQHYDYQMSQAFFDDFKLPAPHYYLNIGSGSHGDQTAQTMIAYEQLCLGEGKPALTIVVGDVNATLACSITAKKLHIRVAHLEAGLRSFDRTMPEEINRVVTDAVSDYYWTPSEDASANLLKEGIQSEQISLVGNIMIDAYCMMKNKIQARAFYRSFNFLPQKYIVLTLHRPTNVDQKEVLENIIEKVGFLNLPVIFPAHPRTRKNLKKIDKLPHNIKVIDPVGYVDFMSLISNCAYVISDSGGVQEETTYLKVPCFTLRDTTERPITLTMGSNQLITIDNLLDKVLCVKKSSVPPLWDGKTAFRIKDILKKIL